MKMPRFQNLVTACLGLRALARCLRFGWAAARSSAVAGIAGTTTSWFSIVDLQIERWTAEDEAGTDKVQLKCGG